MRFKAAITCEIVLNSPIGPYIAKLRSCLGSQNPLTTTMTSVSLEMNIYGPVRVVPNGRQAWMIGLGSNLPNLLPAPRRLLLSRCEPSNSVVESWGTGDLCPTGCRA
ncbi:unnamed protein product [Protopolystoma xenopodis]|uniref:Uncharacterized protein n=1 Tax=Protopolystoma xenopodis TaxID=117903 RepID=A0A3S5FG50_9PLAT|nr:unnamed protein product [Protopolystoma xenopodis]